MVQEKFLTGALPQYRPKRKSEPLANSNSAFSYDRRIFLNLFSKNQIHFQKTAESNLKKSILMQSQENAKLRKIIAIITAGSL